MASARIKLIMGGVALVVLVALGYWWMSPLPNSKKWQAVFLTNGQVYFGHLTSRPEHYILTDIYYLQAPAKLQQPNDGAPADQNLNLVKLGDELHGPEDTMVIDRDKVMFWENLKDNSKVVEAIGKTSGK